MIIINALQSRNLFTSALNRTQIDWKINSFTEWKWWAKDSMCVCVYVTVQARAIHALNKILFVVVAAAIVAISFVFIFSNVVLVVVIHCHSCN